MTSSTWQTTRNDESHCGTTVAITTPVQVVLMTGPRSGSAYATPVRPPGLGRTNRPRAIGTADRLAGRWAWGQIKGRVATFPGPS